MNAYYNEDTIIYHNGVFVNAINATTPLYGQSLHYGYAVFEGIRSYKTASGDTKIFKATAHFERLKRSAALLNMPYAFDTENLIQATYTLLEKTICRMHTSGRLYMHPPIWDLPGIRNRTWL